MWVEQQSSILWTPNDSAYTWLFVSTYCVVFKEFRITSIHRNTSHIIVYKIPKRYCMFCFVVRFTGLVYLYNPFTCICDICFNWRAKIALLKILAQSVEKNLQQNKKRKSWVSCTRFIHFLSLTHISVLNIHVCQLRQCERRNTAKLLI